jgi:hypothetical protein
MIIVSVRSTGRVRVHKARENGNHSFSIGKTWALEDLSAIQSWAFYTPRSTEESQMKVWAADIGFTVTLAKPYYWQAGTAKEKEFFIGSLVKIYRKYTQGKVPELTGFSPAELQLMVGGPGQASQQQPPQSQSRGLSASPSRAPPPFSPGRDRGPSFNGSPRGADRQPLSSPDSFSASQPPEGATNQTVPPLRNRAVPPTSNPQGPYQQRAPSAQSQTPSASSTYLADTRPLRQRPSQDTNLRQAPSREQLRPLRSAGPDRLTPQSSQSSFRREGTPDSSNLGGTRQTSGSTLERRSPSQTRSENERGEEAVATNGLGIVSPISDRWRQNGTPVSGRREETGRALPSANDFDAPAPLSNGSRGKAEEPPITTLPERRRPPMTGAQLNGSQGTAPSITAPASRRDGLISPAAASTDSLVTKKMPGGFIPSPAASEQIERDGLLPAPLSLSPKPNKAELAKPAPEPSPAVKPIQPTEEETKEQERKDAEEAARPGLGRMFGGNKKTARDLFKTAANAYGAFVPRAGGAGAKILGGPVAAKETAEPDGISGVVPAPGLLRTRTDDSVRSEQTQGSIQATPTSAKATPSDSLPDPLPQVTVSSPLTPSPADEAKELPQVFNEETPKAAEAAAQQKKNKLAEEEAARRKKRRSAQQTKYLSMLGIDSTILDNRGLEFETMLDDFGWGTSVFHSKSIDVLETDIRREISRVEAGSWLGHLEQKDDRVGAVEKLLDKAIAECDELEGLLTLYSVELSVSFTYVACECPSLGHSLLSLHLIIGAELTSYHRV